MGSRPDVIYSSLLIMLTIIDCLSRYLNRDYWESQAKPKETVKEQTMAKDEYRVLEKVDNVKKSEDIVQGGGLPDTADSDELDEFIMTLRSQLEIFVNRMKSNSSRGRPIANDSSVQTLFMNTMAMHSRLVKHIQEQEDKRVYYEGMQDKLTQVIY